ncbi:hypothetical protein, partial [Slackia piriformis]|uniref:hypothetical protein n=1 Tax=Slackia piriformis TaxID=626934 RepID=UPI0032BF6CCD
DLNNMKKGVELRQRPKIGHTFCPITRNIRPRCINVKDRLGQTASFESGFSFLNPDSKDAAQSPGGPDVRYRA